MFGGEHKTILRRLCDRLGKAINLLSEPGLVKHYNGLEVVHTHDYLNIHVGPYIDKILDGHGWNMVGKVESRLVEPIHPSAIKELETATGLECTKAAAKLAEDAGFKHCIGIGEIIFAYVCCSPDIGYDVAELSKFSTNPAAVHYSTLKRIFRYLRQTKQYVLVYWRPTPRVDLPRIPFDDLRTLDDLDRSIPMPNAIDELCGYLDAAHANCLRTRRSVGAHVFCLEGTAIAYRAKWTAAVCLSSTECEFVTAVGAAKVAKFHRAILIEIKLLQINATMLFEDNAAAIMMANARRPTDRSRHIDIHNFSLQDWVRQGDVLPEHICGTINPADATAKALGRVLHYRHCMRMMGMCGPPFTPQG
jgi:hypothetical protein